MCLQKILHTISTFQSRNVSKDTSLNPHEFDGLESQTTGFGLKNEDRTFFGRDRGVDIDLNLRMDLSLEDVESKPPAENGGFGACSASGEVVDSDSAAVSDGGSKEGAIEVNEKEDEVSEITNLRVESLKFDNNEVHEASKGVEDSKIEVKEEELRRKQKESEDETRSFGRNRYRNEGCLGLLIEAAKLIDSGEFEPVKVKQSRNHLLSNELGKDESQMMTESETATNESVTRGWKRKESLAVNVYGDFEETSPVVRSKRGRSQVLPYKYRDSVVEPLKQLSRRQRSTLVPAKRRRSH
ncbi:hypothetical protein F0562_022167 [Nyssa sinensis]|uniref:Uncharacterized protein n=1 Tax=Nyssa sinensis TaxID=561372 RepID=A0A5J5BQY8_9ASTE|nr:hypothetical protein F0562_022167 [Nyssa sinensis]